MADNPMTSKPGEQSAFCEKAERSGMGCRPCFDGMCTIHGKQTKMYKGLPIHNSINIYQPKSGPGVIVETDIEVPFTPQNAWSVGRGTRDGLRREMQDKEAILTMALGPRLPPDTRLWYHKHYSPNAAPELAALHVHVYRQVDNHAQAHRLASELWDIIDPEALSKLID